MERQFLLGLRAKDPEMRKKFFSLYHESLGKTLFTRLQYIIQIQDWEALSDVFWLKQGLDLLLAILVEDKPVTLAPNSAKVPPLMASGTILDCTGVQPMTTDLPEGAEESPLTFDGLILKQSRFLIEMSQLQVSMIVFDIYLALELAFLQGLIGIFQQLCPLCIDLMCVISICPYLRWLILSFHCENWHTLIQMLHISCGFWYFLLSG